MPEGQRKGKPEGRQQSGWGRGARGWCVSGERVAQAQERGRPRPRKVGQGPNRWW